MSGQDAMAQGLALLTTSELASRWRMSERTLERWRSERYGPAWLILGGQVRYRMTDVEAFEARHRRPGS